MAFLNCHIYSHALYTNISFNLCLPTPGSGDPVDYAMLKDDYGYARGLPLVILLHGMCGDANSWVRFSNIDRYARDRLRAMGCDLTCHEDPGGHDWSFWDREIQAALDWLLKDRTQAKSSVIMG